jgi:predicted phosphoribosyltransferase
MFKNREEAGKLLAYKLAEFKSADCLVFGLVRGGLVIARYLASELNFPYAPIVVKKIGSPVDPELAIGAICHDSSVILDQALINRLNISKCYLKQIIEEKKYQVKKLIEYLGIDKALRVKGKTVIVCDDGIATGSSILACIKYLRKRQAEKIIIAVPVVEYDIKLKLLNEVESIISLETPRDFTSVGRFYMDFSQITDKEVKSLII